MTVAKSGLTVVMPVYNAIQHLDRVLPPLLAALERGEIDELIAVDDCSTDGSDERCRAAGMTMIMQEKQGGPGDARNRGVEAASTHLVLFVDSDVVIHESVPRQVVDLMTKKSECVALFGSYDDHPAAPGLVSRYRNLLHHFVHQNGREEASTFWAGCGAVRREAFLAVGGFDIQRYAKPTIEDIELARRLIQAGGKIVLAKDILSTHLKRWTFSNMLYTDVFCRALPWSRLILSSKDEVNDLNVSSDERLRAVLAGFCWLSMAMVPLLYWLLASNFESGVWTWLGALGPALATFSWAAIWDRKFLSLIARRMGILAVLPAHLLHQFYYLYGAMTFAYCMVEVRFSRKDLASSTAPR